MRHPLAAAPPARLAVLAHAATAARPWPSSRGLRPGIRQGRARARPRSPTRSLRDRAWPPLAGPLRARSPCPCRKPAPWGFAPAAGPPWRPGGGTPLRAPPSARQQAPSAQLPRPAGLCSRVPAKGLAALHPRSSPEGQGCRAWPAPQGDRQKQRVGCGWVVLPTPSIFGHFDHLPPCLGRLPPLGGRLPGDRRSSTCRFGAIYLEMGEICG